MQPGGAAQFGRQETFKTKDFAHIAVFNGDLGQFPDWADRMAAKLVRAHPRMANILEWAERQANVITESVELASSDAQLNIVYISNVLYDILMERTGQRLFDKRRNAGLGRGLEYWRILKRDFGMESADAQLAKLQMFIKPARCGSVAVLGEALDKWEALGRELTKPMDDDFKLLALRELVPKHLAELMTTQASLRAYPEAIMFVRRQVAEHRHDNQVKEIQRQARTPHTSGPTPMDLSTLYAAIAALQGANNKGDGSSSNEPRADEEQVDVETIIAAIKGKGKGKGKGQKENRECYNCGKTGHLARNCPAPKGKGKSTGKGESGGKGDGKRPLHYLGDHRDEADDEEGITLGCLIVETPLNVMRQKPAEEWEDYECVEALLDSGAGECVCGPDHFEGTPMCTDPKRPGASTEYVTADGGRISNLGEKHVKGISEEGSRLGIKFQVANVDRPLIAVSRLTAAGHEVWFGKDGGTITNKANGRITHFRKRNNVYVMRMWVQRPKPQATRDSRLSGGSRQ